MRHFATTVLGFAVLAGCRRTPSPATQQARRGGVVELPRPNSGAFTFAEAEARKSSILSNEPSGPLWDWKNPGVGFAIHVDARDRLTVYAVSSAYIGPPLEDGAELSVDDIREIEKRIVRFGNPFGVLITSDRQLRHSSVIQDLLGLLFRPDVQLLYLAGE